MTKAVQKIGDCSEAFAYGSMALEAILRFRMFCGIWHFEEEDSFGRFLFLFWNTSFRENYLEDQYKDVLTWRKCTEGARGQATPAEPNNPD